MQVLPSTQTKNMRSLVLEYHRLKGELVGALNGSPEEDDILDKMDDIWWAMTPSERRQVDPSYPDEGADGRNNNDNEPDRPD